MSYWQASAPTFTAGADAPGGQYDVAIIGGGFTGLSAARHLAKAGKKVALFEAKELGHGASCRNGGHLNNGLAHGYGEVMARFGAEKARALYHAYDAAIDLIEGVIAEEGIDCDFRRSGKLKIASKPSHVAGLRQSCDLICKEADPDVQFLDASELTGEIKSDVVYGAMLYKKSAMMHMGRYLHGLATATAGHGAEIFENCPVTERHHAGSVWHLQTPKGALQAKDIIVATGAYSGHFAPKALRYFSRRVVPVGSFIVATRPLTDDEIAQSVPGNRTYVTSLNIGHYFRLSPDNRLIFGGRAKFSSRSDAQSDRASADILRRSLEEMFPSLKGIAFDYCFGGLVDITQDRLPRAGKADGVYYAMGYSGHGAQLSNYMGVVLADTILGRGRNPFDDIAWPSVPIYSGRPWFLPAVGLYYRLKDALS